jgi:hypothetical protein
LHHQNEKIMIQRVQTLFLLGVIVCLGLMFIVPIWEISSEDSGIRQSLDVFYLYEYASAGTGMEGWTETSRTPAFYIAGLAGLAALLALYVVFRYDKRMLQIKLNALNAFLIMALIAAMAYLIYQGEQELSFQLKGTYKVGFFLPLAALILNSIANRFIRKDEALVKSVDRIR